MPHPLRCFIGAVVLGGLLAASTTTKADVVPTLQSIIPENGNFRWTYEAFVGLGQRVEPAAGQETGDFFTIYSFAGFVPGTNTQPEGWAFSAQLVGVTPTGLLPGDDPSQINLTWTRTGGTIGTGEFPVDLGEFSAVSSFGDFVLGPFAGRGTLTDEPEAGNKVANTGEVPVPIPLPAAALMFPLGALLAGYFHRRMRKQMA